MRASPGSDVIRIAALQYGSGVPLALGMTKTDLEQPTPQSRLDAELGCDRGQADGAWRLRRSGAESGRADNANLGNIWSSRFVASKRGSRALLAAISLCPTNVSDRCFIAGAKLL
jgi:hypothetical protein